jgi:hypothetical protein
LNPNTPPVNYVGLLERARLAAQKGQRRVTKALFGESKKKTLGDIIKNHKFQSLKNFNCKEDFQSSTADTIKQIVDLKKNKKMENVSTLLRFYKVCLYVFLLI